MASSYGVPEVIILLPCIVLKILQGSDRLSLSWVVVMSLEGWNIFSFIRNLREN